MLYFPNNSLHDYCNDYTNTSSSKVLRFSQSERCFLVFAVHDSVRKTALALFFARASLWVKELVYIPFLYLPLKDPICYSTSVITVHMWGSVTHEAIAFLTALMANLFPELSARCYPQRWLLFLEFCYRIRDLQNHNWVTPVFLMHP